MKISLPWIVLPAGIVSAWKAMTAYSPEHPEIHDKIINAAGRYFVIGVQEPTTYCGLDDVTKCPEGSSTLVNDNLTSLASAMPGGQNIFVDKMGHVSYTLPHSTYRPPGAQIGGFYSYRLLTDCAPPVTVLSWESYDGENGLWACPVDPDTPVSVKATLKASMKDFKGSGCLKVEGIKLSDAGDDFAAWAYV